MKEGPASGLNGDGLAADVRRQIRAGESAALEFKASLRHDVRTGNVNKELTKAVAKTVAGFMNALGGTLLIGVSDDGALTGIEPDLGTLSRKDVDGFERVVRNALGTYLGVEIGPHILVEFARIDDLTLARLGCPPYHSPVFLRDGDRQEFYVRDGNQTRPLDVRASHEYIRAHWPTEPGVTPDALRDIVAQLLQEHLTPEYSELLRTAMSVPSVEPRPPELPPRVVGEVPPAWIKVGSRRVLDLFLGPLARSAGWKRLFIISPWISDIEHSASLTFNQLLKRLRDDRATAYVVTRPPEYEWHRQAITRLGETGRANIAIIPELHIKLYTALTKYGSFAMLGSANFTQQSLINREIGLLIDSYADGRRLVSELQYEAAQIYRIPGRRLLYQASFTLS